jgi:hypothetical protein
LNLKCPPKAHMLVLISSLWHYCMVVEAPVSGRARWSLSIWVNLLPERVSSGSNHAWTLYRRYFSTQRLDF